MKVIDANLLLYAYDESSAYHVPARRWIEDVFSSTEQVRLPWVVIMAFLRISTHRRALTRPFAISEASSIVGEWLDLPNVDVLPATDQHWEVLSRLLTDGQVRGSLVTDAHIAALAMEHGAILCTNDRGFLRFQGLAVDFPLSPSTRSKK